MPYYQAARHFDAFEYLGYDFGSEPSRCLVACASVVPLFWVRLIRIVSIIDVLRPEKEVGWIKSDYLLTWVFFSAVFDCTEGVYDIFICSSAPREVRAAGSFRSCRGPRK